jgi:hypothetical protein
VVISVPSGRSYHGGFFGRGDVVERLRVIGKLRVRVLGVVRFVEQI